MSEGRLSAAGIAASVEAGEVSSGDILRAATKAFAAAEETDLPNVAAAGGRIGAKFRAEIADSAVRSVVGASNSVGSARRPSAGCARLARS